VTESADCLVAVLRQLSEMSVSLCQDDDVPAEETSTDDIVSALLVRAYYMLYSVCVVNNAVTSRVLE